MFSIDTSKFDEFLEAEKQRQLAMAEVSKMIGVDVTFSDKEIIRNAEEKFSKYVSEEVNKWMKSALSLI
jgi:hypothetical protein